MPKNLEISLLLDFYGEMLTQKQRSFLTYYYDEDLSLSEIAENEGITRQGVRDAVKRAEAQLIEMESKLHMAAKHEELHRSLAEISACAENINSYNLSHDLSREINDNVTKIRSLVEILSDQSFT